MADSTTYHRFALTFNSPWTLGTKTNHNWHSKFSVSGTILMSAVDAEATALDLAVPMLALCSAKTYLLQWSYYPSGTNVAAATKVYQPTDHPATGTGFTGAGNLNQQLEVAAVAHCPVGVNSRGKEVYLRKWIHDIQSLNSDYNHIGQLTNPTTQLDKWNHGAGPHSVVPVSPTKGTQGGPWSIETHLFTHQLRKGKKKKVAKGVSPSTLLQLLQQVASGSLTAEALKLILANL